ncbi:hypothetical protein ACFYY8_35335 [Streptosporangium sp. NPDC001559]|uniref:hypothetical protein n=1 Tax=Streptosporangium sp. NPDC001559 TaxID=3366187 RepID=UPI0036E135D0
MRSVLLGAATGLAVLFTVVPPAAARLTTRAAQVAAPEAGNTGNAGNVGNGGNAGNRVVYGWAVRSGNSAFSITPRRAVHGHVGESGLLAWELGRKAGAPLTIRYTGRLDFRQVNRTCGRPSAGYPYDTSDRSAYGTRRCSSAHLRKLLKDRIAVRVEYTGALVAVKVRELVLP